MRREMRAGRPQQVELPLVPALVNEHQLAQLPQRNESELRNALAEMLRAAAIDAPRSTTDNGGKDDR